MSPGKYLLCVQFLLEEVDLSLALWMARGAIQPIYLKAAWGLPCKCNKIKKLVLSSLDMGHLEPVQNEATNQPAVSKSIEPSVTNNTSNNAK